MRAGNADAQSTIDEYYPACTTPSGIHTPNAAAVVSVKYYTIDGKQVTSPTKGIYVVRRTLSDGTVINSKVSF